MLDKVRKTINKSGIIRKRKTVFAVLFVEIPCMELTAYESCETCV